MTFYPRPSWERQGWATPLPWTLRMSPSSSRTRQIQKPSLASFGSTKTQSAGSNERPKWLQWLRPTQSSSLCPHGHRGLAQLACVWEAIWQDSVLNPATQQQASPLSLRGRQLWTSGLRYRSKESDLSRCMNSILKHKDIQRTQSSGGIQCLVFFFSFFVNTIILAHRLYRDSIVWKKVKSEERHSANIQSQGSTHCAEAGTLPWMCAVTKPLQRQCLVTPLKPF